MAIAVTCSSACPHFRHKWEEYLLRAKASTGMDRAGHLHMSRFPPLVCLNWRCPVSVSGCFSSSPACFLCSMSALLPLLVCSCPWLACRRMLGAALAPLFLFCFPLVVVLFCRLHAASLACHAYTFGAKPLVVYPSCPQTRRFRVGPSQG